MVMHTPGTLVDKQALQPQQLQLQQQARLQVVLACWTLTLKARLEVVQRRMARRMVPPHLLKKMTMTTTMRTTMRMELHPQLLLPVQVEDILIWMK